MATIDITPRFNTERIQAYATNHGCRDPQSHIAARLELLSELSELIDVDAERDGGESITVEKLIWEIQRRHQATTNEFLGFFGTPESGTSDTPEIRSGPSDEVLRALARHDYGSDDIEIDGNAVVSRGEDPGAFVAAWVWVEFPKDNR